MSENLPSHARVVIIGGGIVGASVAYHLTRLGWTDVVLLERREISCGTTWHAAGLVGQLRATQNLTRLAAYGAELYSRLEGETGQATGFRRCGSLSVARTSDRMIELKRSASMARCFGIDVDVITPSEAGTRWPLMRTNGRSRRRPVDSGRRTDESDRHDTGARDRRTEGRRAGPREREGHGDTSAPGRGGGRDDGPWRARLRVRGERGRHVGA